MTAALGAAGLTWSLIEAHAFVLRRVQVPALPPGSPSIRVLHISDLHLMPRQERKIAWVRSLAHLEPDLVVNTGDNISHRESLGPLLRALDPLLARPGVFALGSNDFFGPTPKNPARYLLRDARREPGERREPDLPGYEMRAAFMAAGWRDLGNARADLEVGDVRISAVGTHDAHLNSDRMPAAPAGARPEAGRHEAGRDEAALHLGVTHAPYQRVLTALRADGCDLVLAGHTHGGQLCVPGYGALTTNCDLDTGRAKGLHGWPGARPDIDPTSMWLHVSAGLGTSPYTPVRFACRPEATLLELAPR